LEDQRNNLSEFPIGKLFAFVARQQAIQTDRLMEGLGLYRGQAFLLMTLSGQDGLTHSEIAERLEISPAATTKVIKRMEALNYVQRQSDPEDERISRVFLLAEGWSVIQQIRQVFRHMDEILCSNLSAEEQVTLTSLLVKVYDSLAEQALELS